jgi:CRP-like cAMP-binding protein
MDHNLATLVKSTIGFIPHHLLRAYLRDHPRIADVFWRDTLIEAAIFREWIANVGGRVASSRVAHVLCEMYVRLHATGAIADGSFEFLFRFHNPNSVTQSGYPPSM